MEGLDKDALLEGAAPLKLVELAEAEAFGSKSGSDGVPDFASF